MAVFTRRRHAPKVKGDHTKFRPFVRQDFSEGCAYCLLHELLAGGPRNFELDHFRPKSLLRFAALIADFFNLYYACHVCNANKWNHWPSVEEEAIGIGFIDFCRDDFSDHFRENRNGRWIPLTPSAEFTLDILNLNSAHLVELRARLRRIARQRKAKPINWNRPAKSQIANLFG